MRITRMKLDTSASVTFRGAICAPDPKRGRDEVGILDLVRELFQRSALESAESCSKSLFHIRESRGGKRLRGEETTVPLRKEEKFMQVEERLGELRERLVVCAQELIPGASNTDAREIASLAFEIPSEIFQRRNLWDLKLE
jgi:hypothetical protein